MRRIRKDLFRHLPNALSLFRLVLALAIPFSPERCWIWMVAGGGGSDFLDGWIARRWKLESWQGGLLDAGADKMFILAALLTFAAAERFSIWWVPVLIVRDLTVVLIAAYAAGIGAWAAFRKMEARLTGKAATGGQFLFLLLAAHGSTQIHFVLGLSVIFGLVASADYGRQFILALRDRRRNAHGEEEG